TEHAVGPKWRGRSSPPTAPRGVGGASRRRSGASGRSRCRPPAAWAGRAAAGQARAGGATAGPIPCSSFDISSSDNDVSNKQLYKHLLAEQNKFPIFNSWMPRLLLLENNVQAFAS
ncbi:unnamed protein product, partial [Urochloa humidicola]